MALSVKYVQSAKQSFRRLVNWAFPQYLNPWSVIVVQRVKSISSIRPAAWDAMWCIDRSVTCLQYERVSFFNCGQPYTVHCAVWIVGLIDDCFSPIFWSAGTTHPMIRARSVSPTLRQLLKSTSCIFVALLDMSRMAEAVTSHTLFIFHTVVFGAQVAANAVKPSSVMWKQLLILTDRARAPTKGQMILVITSSVILRL